MNPEPILTYKTIHNRVLGLSGLTVEQEDFLRRCYQLYRAEADWITIAYIVEGSENPMIRDAGGWVTRAVWEHPFYRAVRDLENRAAIRQGDADEHLDGRRLAGPVGPKETDDLALGQGERNRVDGPEGAVQLGEVLDFENGLNKHERLRLGMK